MMRAIKLLKFIQDTLKNRIENMQLNIITEQAYCLDKEVIDVHQSMFNGLIKTIILEHPELNIRQIDVEKNANTDANVFAELPLTQNVIAIRDKKLFVPRLMTQTQSAQLYDQLCIPQQLHWQLEQTKRGNIDSLILTACEENALKENEVEIEVKVVGLNFRDVLVALDLYPGESGGLGGDCAGVITRVGHQVKRVSVGERVFGIALGAFKSHVTTNQKLITRLPDDLSFVEGASLPVVMMTARYALNHLAKIKQGDKVLIHTGAGGVGLLAIQLAQKAGAIIYATASKEKQAYLKTVGVKHIYDSRTTRYGDEILKDTGGAGVDVILNTLTSEGFKETSLSCLKKNGIFLEISKRNIYSIPQMTAIRSDVQYHIIAIDRMFTEDPDRIEALLSELVLFLKNKKIIPPYLRTYSIERLPEAMKMMQKGKQMGKLVLTFPPAQWLLKEKAAYLITGGLGGIGLELAKHLAEHGAKKIILASRRVANDKIKMLIKQLQEKDVDVVIKQVDVSDKTQVEKMLQDSHTATHPLQGIFHAAGVIDDALIEGQTAEKFETVFAAKAQSAWYLHEITKQMKINLDYFVFFSSIASLMGSPSQSNYAAANSFLDGLAYERRQQGLAAQSIHWGPWREVGMGKDLISIHERQGFKPLKTQEGLDALTYALKQGKTEIGIVKAAWVTVGKQWSLTPSWLSELIHKKDNGQFMLQLQTLSEEQRGKVLKETLILEIKKVLGMSNTASIDEQQNLFEFGMDSLMVMQLVNVLRAKFEEVIAISVQDVIECESLSRLNSLIERKVNFAILHENKHKKELKEHFLGWLTTPATINEQLSDKRLHPEKIIKPTQLFLTGCTGILGAYLIKSLLEKSDMTLYCLVRAKNIDEAMERIRTVVGCYDPLLTKSTSFSQRVIPVVGDVEHPHLGLMEDEYQKLTQKINMVLHVAANTSLLAKFNELKKINVDGTQHVIDFAMQTKTKCLGYCSSYGVFGHQLFSDNHPFDETQFDVGQSFKNMGYQQTKFEAEKIVCKAQEKGLQWMIFRPGNIMGDTNTGYYPFEFSGVSSVYYDVFKTAIESGVSPLSPLYFDISPVNYVADAICYWIAHYRVPYTVAHLTNVTATRYMEWMFMLQQLKYAIRFVSPLEYVDLINRGELRDHLGVHQSKSTQLISAYPEQFTGKQSTAINTAWTQAILKEGGIECPVVDMTTLDRYLQFCHASGIIMHPDNLDTRNT